MSPIIGTYTNAMLNAQLVISNANDSNGDISGTFSLGKSSWPIKGTWNTSTVAPNAVLYFTGSSVNPTVVVAGTGAALDFKTFDGTTLNISLSQKGGSVTSLSGPFVRS